MTVAPAKAGAQVAGSSLLDDSKDAKILDPGFRRDDGDAGIRNDTARKQSQILMNVVLIGFMCSGKSRVGRSLAGKLGWSFVDTDDHIVKETGMSIARTIREKGEPAFRATESRVIERLSGVDAAVIATGGGAPLSNDNFMRLEKLGPLVWLRVSADTVLKRVADMSTRPLISPADPRGSIERRLKEREPVYARAAFALDADLETPDQLADRIRDWLKTR